MRENISTDEHLLSYLNYKQEMQGGGLSQYKVGKGAPNIKVVRVPVGNFHDKP